MSEGRGGGGGHFYILIVFLGVIFRKGSNKMCHKILSNLWGHLNRSYGGGRRIIENLPSVKKMGDPP